MMKQKSEYDRRADVRAARAMRERCAELAEEFARDAPNEVECATLYRLADKIRALDIGELLVYAASEESPDV